MRVGQGDGELQSEREAGGESGGQAQGGEQFEGEEEGGWKADALDREGEDDKEGCER